jgi:hypothetical protein
MNSLFDNSKKVRAPNTGSAIHIILASYTVYTVPKAMEIINNEIIHRFWDSVANNNLHLVGIY